MARLSYFQRYTQRENAITNNTLLLFHRLYERSGRRFQRFLTEIVKDQVDGPALEFGLEIVQQVGSGASILDGFLRQSAVRVAIETKLNAGAFDEGQIRRHLAAFVPGQSGYLFLVAPELLDLRADRWSDLCDEAEQKNVYLVALSFEKVISCARNVTPDFDEEMNEIIQDFEEFCSAENLLPTDKFTIFVPPCTRSHEINIRQHLYFCPATWSRRKFKYLGIYYDKSVRALGELKKVVYYEVQREGRPESFTVVEGDAITEPEKERIRSAVREAYEANGWYLDEYKFYLCDCLQQMNYAKASAGGIYGHRYFNLKEIFEDNEIPESLPEIAESLSERTWG